jgi:hypothetical protein
LTRPSGLRQFNAQEIEEVSVARLPAAYAVVKEHEPSALLGVVNELDLGRFCQPSMDVTKNGSKAGPVLRKMRLVDNHAFNSGFRFQELGDRLHLGTLIHHDQDCPSGFRWL